MRLSTLPGVGARGRGRAATGADGKVVGLPPATVDRLWAEGLADYVLVEADGSRGLPLKAFASNEPRGAGDASSDRRRGGRSGRRRQAAHGGARAPRRRLASTLGVPLGVEVTPQLFARALGEQVRRIRGALARQPRLAVLLNKADGTGTGKRWASPSPGVGGDRRRCRPSAGGRLHHAGRGRRGEPPPELFRARLAGGSLTGVWLDDDKR